MTTKIRGCREREGITMVGLKAQYVARYGTKAQGNTAIQQYGNMAVGPHSIHIRGPVVSMTYD